MAFDRPGSPQDSPGAGGRHAAVRDAVAFCARQRNLRRTVRIALVVGLLLTLINQGAVIASGHATAATWLRCVLNFVVPFLVSNAGLLSSRH
ncbi:MAG: nitrate/nitrite transporter NrtS [Solirubrobacteraceae bacterium]